MRQRCSGPLGLEYAFLAIFFAIIASSLSGKCDQRSRLCVSTCPSSVHGQERRFRDQLAIINTQSPVKRNFEQIRVPSPVQSVRLLVSPPVPSGAFPNPIQSRRQWRRSRKRARETRFAFLMIHHHRHDHRC